MFELILENQRGDSVALTNNKNYVITDIDGLHPADANIVTSQVSLYDGSKFNNAKVNERQLDIAVAIQYDVENSRVALYKVIKPKRYIKMIYRTDSRDVYCEGYVSAMQIDYFENPQTVAISILCPEPYFNAAQEIIDGISRVIKMFHFPFAITAAAPKPLGAYDNTLEINVINSGDVETGFEIEIHATGQVKTPAIYNRDTGEFFKLSTTLQDGDTVHINTKQGQKSVSVMRAGENINLFNYISDGSTWLQLSPGDNILTYDAADNTTTYMDIRFIHRDLYVGV